MIIFNISSILKRIIYKFYILSTAYLHPVMLRIVKKIRKYDIKFINKVDEINEPVIFAVNHSSMYDIPIAIETLKSHFHVLAGSENLDLRAKILFKLNGVVYVNRKDKKNRSSSKKRLAKLLLKGKNILIFPEGTWNLSDNKIMLPLNWGIIDIAKSTKAPILPVIMEYNNETCYINAGSIIRVMDDEKNEEVILELTDRLATLRWEVWDIIGVKKRKDTQRCEFHEYVKKRVSEYATFDIEFENSIILNKNKFNNEIYDFINNIEITKENAFLLKNRY